MSNVWIMGAACLALTLTSQAQCRFANSGKGQQLTYRFSVNDSPATPGLRVEMEFPVNGTGVMTLVLPTGYAGEQLHGVTDVHAISERATLEDGPDKGTLVLHAPAGGRAVITYLLKKDWTGPLVNPLQFHAVVLPEYFEFTGSNSLVRPQLEHGAIETAHFDWTKLPATWSIATSFGESTSSAGACQTVTGPWEQVEGGLYAGGDYRIHKFLIDGKPAVLAVRGNWTFTDDHAIEQIQKVVGTVREFWHDNNFPYFLVTLKPYDRDHGSSDGSQFTNSFWMYVSRLDSIDNLLPQLAHESFHAWNPKMMGYLSDKSYGDLKWFKEGFTEYYAQRIMYGSGDLPLSRYIESINVDLHRFPDSKDEYVRGRIIALWLDAKIRQDSSGKRSLDDVMFRLVKDRKQPLTLNRVFETIRPYVDSEAFDALKAAGSGTGDLAAPTQIPLVGPCVHVLHQDFPTYDLGFDYPATQTSKAMAGVAESGPAFAAGLRDGQPVIGYSITKNNPDKMVRVTVHTDGKDNKITYYPRGKAVLGWQYQINEATPCEPLQLKRQ